MGEGGGPKADREILHKTRAELVNRTRLLYYSALKRKKNWLPLYSAKQTYTGYMVVFHLSCFRVSRI